ncbi:MAG: hypothetical protein CMB37_03985 [Euryarchaeota archaeon]|nr:hypothetical protein [Euryarchaeota archaeon]MED5486308.1 choice-of-anchor V domain-containing protein [Candidatus Thermoplasmatota archaeon]
MSRASIRFAVLLTLLLLLAGPAFAAHLGPPSDNNGDGSGEATWRAGCSCHAASPSTSTLVKVSGVPAAYEAGLSYTMTLTLEHSTNAGGGFFLSTEGVGTFSWTDDQLIRPEKDSGEDKTATSTGSGITQSDYTSPAEWIFTWTAPSSDVGDIGFWVVGNMVDGDGAPGATDHWNGLTFIINSPSTTSAAADQSTRVISSGDASLFDQTVDEEALEIERQHALSEVVMHNGIVWFFITLIALVVGAVVQKEILERRYGTGPAHLDRQLAYPEGLRRSLLAIGTAFLGMTWLAGDSATYLWSTAFFISIWSTYGVYRTILAARTPPTVKDMM